MLMLWRTGQRIEKQSIASDINANRLPWHQKKSGQQTEHIPTFQCTKKIPIQANRMGGSHPIGTKESPGTGYARSAARLAKRVLRASSG